MTTQPVAQIVSVKETAPGVWRVTYDGRWFGDSRGYDRAGAVTAACREITGRVIDDGDWSRVVPGSGEKSVWVEKLRIRVLDPAL